MATVFEKMTELADAIRSKSGVSGSLTIDQMIAAVGGIVSGGGGLADAAYTSGEIGFDGGIAVRTGGSTQLQLNRTRLDLSLFAVMVFPLSKPKYTSNGISTGGALNYSGLGFADNTTTVTFGYKYGTSSSSTLGSNFTGLAVMYVEGESVMYIGPSSTSYAWCTSGTDTEGNTVSMEYAWMAIGRKAS